MNKKQLENLGIKYLRQNTYIIHVATTDNVTGIHVTINNDTSMIDIIQQIFDKGFLLGLHYGETKKANEIKKLLNIE